METEPPLLAMPPPPWPPMLLEIVSPVSVRTPPLLLMPPALPPLVKLLETVELVTVRFPAAVIVRSRAAAGRVVGKGVVGKRQRPVVIKRRRHSCPSRR